VFIIVLISGGWSNNPTALHFKYIFRRLLARSGALAVSPSANVSALEEFNITSAATSTYLPPTNFRLDNDIVEPGQDLDLETPPAEFHGQLSPLVENVVVYIAGNYTYYHGVLILCTYISLHYVLALFQHFFLQHNFSY
jgi:hypothetical protein